MKYKVKIDRLVCISLASCTVMAPTVYKLEEETGKAIIDPEITKTTPEVHSIERYEETDEAGTKHFIWNLEADADWVEKNLIPGAQACPVTAVHIWDADTNEVIYPK